MAAVMPDRVLYADALNQSTLLKLKEIRDLKLVSKLGIQTQLRIILNAMDPKMRMNPCCRDLTEAQNAVRQVFASDSFMINVASHLPKDDREMESDMKVIGKCIACIVQEPYDVHKLCFAVGGSRIQNEPIKRAFDVIANKSSMFLKLVAACLGERIVVSSQINDVTFFPSGDKVKPIKMKNLVNLVFYSYSGFEKVRFESQGVSGYFDHDSELISSISMTKGSPEEIRTVLGAIAAYCKWGFTSSRMRTIKRMTNECFVKYKNCPWEIMSISADTYKRTTARCRSNNYIRFMEETDVFVPRLSVLLQDFI